MNLTIQTRHIALSANDKAFIRRQFEFAFSRLNHAADKVSVILSDINGPKGGYDKQCKLMIHIPGRKKLVIKDTKDNMLRAVDSAVNRARYALEQLKRKRVGATTRQIPWRRHQELPT